MNYMIPHIQSRFETPREKGIGEWATFRSVIDDTVSRDVALKYRIQLRMPTAIYFGNSPLFILKRT